MIIISIVDGSFRERLRPRCKASHVFVERSLRLSKVVHLGMMG
jgi:hypothetical protein